MFKLFRPASQPFPALPSPALLAELQKGHRGIEIGLVGGEPRSCETLAASSFGQDLAI